MNYLVLPPINKLILFGGGPLMLEYALWAVENFECYLFTAPRQADEMIPSSGFTFAEMADRSGLSIHIVENINTDLLLPKLVDKGSLGIGFGEAWKFDTKMLGLFDGRLIDFMGIALPKYRGGAHYTWAILRDENQWGCHLQIINEDTVQGWFDSGDIVASYNYQIDSKISSPQDFFDYCVIKELNFIKKFSMQLSDGTKLKLSPVEEGNSLFFPRLNTLKNGWLDWRWNGGDIVRFINAFSSPYKGASTRINGKRVLLISAILDSREGVFHPYQSGMIARVDNNGVWIMTTSGLINIKQVRDKNGGVFQHKLLVGDRFITTENDLIKSISYRPNYDTHGDNNALIQYDEHTSILKEENLYLRPVVERDCTQQYLDWLMDPDVNQFLETRWEEQNVDSIQEFVLSIIQSPSDKLYAIISKDTNTHIGNIKLGNINKNHDTAEVSYFIGDKNYWGHGYASEALRAITHYAVNDLGLNYIFAGVYQSNKASCRVLEKVGYTLQGRLKNKIINSNGKREDHLYYGYTVE